MIIRDVFFKCSDVLKNIISPPHCSSCKKFLHERSVFCFECEKKLKPIVSHTLDITPSKSIKVFSVSRYVDPIKALILSKRYGNYVSCVQLAQLILEKTFLKEQEFDYLVPIPLHWTRYARRGFNQAEVIARTIGKETGIPVINLLKRVKMTSYQSKLSSTDRYSNVKKAFKLNVEKDQYIGKRLLLIDDLMTTGATLKAAAKTLLPLKPVLLQAVVAARVV